MAVGDVEQAEKAGPSRPAARGSTGPSRHHLEPNPFEQSFSSKPSNQRSESPEGANKAGKNAKKLGHKATKSETGIKQEGSAEEQDAGSKASNSSESGKGDANNNTSQTPSKRILPPVSSIASPAAQEASSMQYPWSSSLTGSLRSGPLSPAMLAGPQSSFDVSNFRSGFTPDLSNFKTGLTPLGASSASYPPPSPNTAAFLAMVTNGSAPGLSGATITPNTLSALSGNPMDSHANSHSMVSSQPGHNGDAKGAPAPHHGSEQHDQFDFAFGRSMQDTPTKQPLGSSKLRNSASTAVRGQEFNDHTSNGGKQGVVQQQHQAQGQQKDNGNQMTTQAASGLFLLSQAHQELSKREDAAAAAAAAATTGQDSDMQGLNGHQLYNNSNANAKPNKAAKRKKSVEPAGPTAKPGSGKKAKANATSKFDDSMGGPDDEGYESDELDEDGNRRQKSSNGDGGDDEEKRKNFLERNRQAALKCRQRKKAWLASLQAKVEYLQSDNENLQGTVSALRNEVMFLKSQLMQAQRQYPGGPPAGLPANAMDGGQGSQPALGRNSVSGPVPMQGNGIAMSHNMPSQSPQHQQNNINAMAVAAAAAAAANNNAHQGSGNHRVGGAAASGQYQAHAVPRPTHIPGQPNSSSQQQPYHQSGQKHARQSSAQAA